MLYHLSVKKGLTKLTPQIPECAISFLENTSIKRICFSDYIEGCLSALQDIPQKYYVYTPIDDELKLNIFNPTTKDVPDVKMTHEKWILNEIKVKCIGVIKSELYDYTTQHNIGLGRRSTFFHYPYKWISIENN